MSGSHASAERFEQGPKSSSALEVGLTLGTIVPIPVAGFAPEGTLKNVAILVSAASFVALLVDQYIKGDFSAETTH